jgi:Fe-S cluster assembly protein SufD
VKNKTLNRIKIVDDVLSDVKVDDAIEVTETSKNEIFDVTSIYLIIKKDTNLEIDYSTRKATKLDVKIKVMPGVNLDLREYRFGKNFKIRYQYSLMENSNTKVYKFYDVAGIKEMNIIHLSGINANIDYNFKTISTGCEKYNMTIYHQASNTNSDIKNNGVNINKGSLQFNVSSFVNSGNIGCNINQASRIINLTENKCQINPNLFIDEYDVSANHSALIGKFSDAEMFYLGSRGIDEKTALNLLINGFLTSNMPTEIGKKITKNINKYWR